MPRATTHPARRARAHEPCWLLLVWLVACTRDVTLATRRPAPTAGSGAPLSASERAGARSAPVLAPTAGGSDGALKVRIEDIRQLEISIITLTCAGDCAEIAAVASGGNPPYTLSWEDGSHDAQRRVCLQSDATLHVAVSDSPLQSAEFKYQPQTANADVSAEVLDCARSGGDFCIKNPSLEGNPGFGIGTPDSVPPGWVVCDFTPDIGPSVSDLAPTDGHSYLGISTFSDSRESAGGEFCAPLTAAKPVAFKVDLAVTTSYALGPARLEIWGGLTACAKDELLWTSQTVQNQQPWSTQCGVLKPSKSYPFLRILPDAMGAPTTYLAVDNFRAAPSCD